LSISSLADLISLELKAVKGDKPLPNKLPSVFKVKQHNPY
jgi:hypothetical protein